MRWKVWLDLWRILNINRHFRHPVGAVANRTGLECFISSEIHYSLGKTTRIVAGKLFGLQT